MKRRGTVLALVALLSAMVGIAGAEAGTFTGEVKIGVILPMSGPMAQFGEDEWIGFEVARDMLNDKGGLGGKEVKYVRMDAPDAKAAVAAADHLINTEKVKVITGTFSSALSYAASQVAERNKVIYWEANAIADNIMTRGFKYLFREGAVSSDLGKLAVSYLAEVAAPALGVPVKDLSVAIINEDTLYGTTMSDGVAEAAKTRGLNIVLRDSYNLKTTDLSSLILKLRSRKVEAVIATSYLNDAILFNRQSRDLGYTPKLLIGTGAGYGVDDLARGLEDDVNGIFDTEVPFGINPQRLRPEAQAVLADFMKRFRAKAGRDPKLFGIYGFSGVYTLLHHVLPKAPTLDPEKIYEAAMSLDLPDGSTVMGWGVKFARAGEPMAGQNVRAKPVMMQWQSRQLKVVYPASLATARPVIPLPPFGQRGAAK